MHEFMIGQREEGGYSLAFASSRERLEKLSPQQIAQNTTCEFNPGNNCFRLESFGIPFEVSYQDGDVRFQGQEGIKPIIPWRLLLLNSLSEAKDLPVEGKWISYKDQPNGNVFHPAINSDVIEPMGRFYDNCDKQALRTSLAQLGFELVEGRAALTARGFFAPKVPVLLQFWDGDDEIPGNFQILFDAGIVNQMHIEDSAGLCELIKYLIVKHYDLAVL